MFFAFLFIQDENVNTYKIPNLWPQNDVESSDKRAMVQFKDRACFYINMFDVKCWKCWRTRSYDHIN